MKQSCIPLHFYREIGTDKTMTYEDWAKMAVDIGLDGTEIYEPFIQDLDASGKEQLSGVLQDAGLQVLQYTIESHLCNPEGREQAWG